MAKRSAKNWTIRICVFLLIATILGVSFIWQSQLEKTINELLNPAISTDVESCELKVHFIDVGQGDSIAIEFPDDKIMLVDAGPGSSEDALINYLNNAIFAKRQDKVIDYFMVTHQDEDHTGGADKVFDNFEVENFYRPKVYTSQEETELGLNLSDDSICDTKVYKTMIEKLQAENCDNVVFHDIRENIAKFDANCGYSIEFLSPVDEVYEDPNDYSPIMILTYMNTKIMLTGDAEEHVEKQVLDLYSKSELDIDVLKLGHHGSSTSTSQDFLDAVNPTYAVICVGEGNKYNHPNEPVLNRVISKIGEHNIYRTDTDGNIVFGIDKDELTNNKGTIKITTVGEVHTAAYIHWWYIVVVIAGVSFVLLILTKKQQKQVEKQLKKKNK